MSLADQKQQQKQHYLSKAYSGTRQYLTTTYSRLPLRYKIQDSYFLNYRAPQFVETTFKRLDEMADPLVHTVIEAVDNQVDQTLVKLAPITDCAKEVG